MIEPEESTEPMTELDQAIDDLAGHFLKHAQIVGGYPDNICTDDRIPGFLFIYGNDHDSEAFLNIVDTDKFLVMWRRLKALVADGEYEDMDEAFLEEGYDETEVHGQDAD